MPIVNVLPVRKKVYKMTVQIDAKIFDLVLGDLTDFWFAINLTNYIGMDTNYRCRIWSAKESNLFYITSLQYVKDFHNIISYLRQAFGIQSIAFINDRVEINHILSKRAICIKLTDKEREHIDTLLRLRGCNIKSF